MMVSEQNDETKLKEVVWDSFVKKENEPHQCNAEKAQSSCSKDLLKSTDWTGNDLIDEVSTEDIELVNIKSEQQFRLLKGVQNWEKHQDITNKENISNNIVKEKDVSFLNAEEDDRINTNAKIQLENLIQYQQSIDIHRALGIQYHPMSPDISYFLTKGTDARSIV